MVRAAHQVKARRMSSPTARTYRSPRIQERLASRQGEEEVKDPAALPWPIARSYCERGAPRSASRFLSQIMMV